MNATNQKRVDLSNNIGYIVPTIKGVNMNQAKEQIDFTDAEKKEWVDAIDAESKAHTPIKPIYKVCEEYGLKLHNYYNWSKAITKREYKAKMKAQKKLKREAKLKVVAAPKPLPKKIVAAPQAPIKRIPIQQAAPKEPTLRKTLVSNPPPGANVQRLRGGKYAVILTDGDHLNDLLKELNF